MSLAFPQKLSLTAALLGCSTRKELAARFRSANPATEFDVERSYKWLQGRALPRSPQVYEDWARVLGTGRPGDWIAACSIEAFIDDLCTHFSADRKDLMARADMFASTTRAPDPREVEDYVQGSYVSLSWAWSPYYRGRLIRGRLDLGAGRRGLLDATYTEVLPTGPIVCHGSAARSGHGLQAALETGQGDGRERLSFTLLVPGRPANVLCGLLQGTIILGPEPQPSSTRIVMFRVPEANSVAIEGAECYLAAVPDWVAPALVRSGIDARCATIMAESALDFLTVRAAGGADYVTPADLSALASVVDRAQTAALQDPTMTRATR